MDLWNRCLVPFSRTTKSISVLQGFVSSQPGQGVLSTSRGAWLGSNATNICGTYDAHNTTISSCNTISYYICFSIYWIFIPWISPQVSDLQHWHKIWICFPPSSKFNEENLTSGAHHGGVRHWPLWVPGFAGFAGFAPFQWPFPFLPKSITSRGNTNPKSGCLTQSHCTTKFD